MHTDKAIWQNGNYWIRGLLCEWSLYHSFSSSMFENFKNKKQRRGWGEIGLAQLQHHWVRGASVGWRWSALGSPSGAWILSGAQEGALEGWSRVWHDLIFFLIYSFKKDVFFLRLGKMDDIENGSWPSTRELPMSAPGRHNYQIINQKPPHVLAFWISLDSSVPKSCVKIKTHNHLQIITQMLRRHPDKLNQIPRTRICSMILRWSVLAARLSLQSWSDKCQQTGDHSAARVPENQAGPQCIWEH